MQWHIMLGYDTIYAITSQNHAKKTRFCERIQKTEDRRQKTEDRRQESEIRIKVSTLRTDSIKPRH